jgi:light-regulated signal transduction histidine kinase (bacteriophytochrome)
LRKIQLFSNKLLDKYDGNDQLIKDVSKLRVEASRMSNLIIAFIKYSHLQVGKTTPQWTDLNKLVEEVILDLQSSITEKDAKIDVGEMPVIKCDPTQISQLFTQLISNSLKFCNCKPEIRIQCSRADDSSLLLLGKKTSEGYFRFRLIDNGIGFNNEYADRVFAIFERLHDPNLYPGVGIGLALCHKIIDNHKGKIAVYSRENEGSTFDVYLQENLIL